MDGDDNNDDKMVTAWIFHILSKGMFSDGKLFFKIIKKNKKDIAKPAINFCAILPALSPLSTETSFKNLAHNTKVSQSFWQDFLLFYLCK